MNYDGQMVAAMLCGFRGCRLVRCMPLGATEAEMSVAAANCGWSKRRDGDGKRRWYCPAHVAERQIAIDTHTVEQ